MRDQKTSPHIVCSHRSKAHKDAVWASRWTAKNQLISASADGTLVQWDVISGQPIRSLPAHALGIVSLSVPALGEFALYNTLEGTTALWDLQSGEIKGEFASYMAKKDGICVANHTSPIDVIILSCDHVYAFVST